MALKGEQFHNTYMPGRPDWLSPEHHTQQGPKHLTNLHSISGMVHDGSYLKGKAWEDDTQITSPVTDSEITTFDVTMPTGELRADNAPVPTPQEGLAPGTQRQGMLFDPYTGTGLPRDPTVSKEQRLAAVDRQLDLRGKGAPQLRETYAMGDTPVSEFDRPIIRSPHGDRSGAPKASEGDEQLVAKRPKITQGRGKRGGGLYRTSTNTATVQSRYGQSSVDYPTRSLTRPTKDATSTGTAWNPDWYTGGSTGTGKGLIPKGGKVEDEAGHGEVTKEILKHSFHNPETGETLNPHTVPNEPVSLPWREDDDSGRNFNTIMVNPPPWAEHIRGAGRRRVTGTSGGGDDYRHLGRFDLRDGITMTGWDSAQTLKDLHEAGFQSELHRGSGTTKEHSRVPPEHNDTDAPQKEYHPKEEGRDPRLGPKPIMLPTTAAEGFMTKKVYGGERYNDSFLDSTTLAFHKRRTPSETENVERQYKVKTDWPDASTAFHEREHAIDPNIGLRTVNRGDTRSMHRDPVMEGIADAGSDRAIHYANVHEDALNPSINQHRHKDITSSTWGYNVKSRAWKTDGDRAVYAATRIHHAMSDATTAIPDRVELVNTTGGDRHGVQMGGKDLGQQKHVDHANEVLLGKLYNDNQHVRDGLDQAGFGRLGAQAAEKHVRRMEDVAEKAEMAAPDEHQMSLWPRTGVNEW